MADYFHSRNGIVEKYSTYGTKNAERVKTRDALFKSAVSVIGLVQMDPTLQQHINYAFINDLIH